MSNSFLANVPSALFPQTPPFLQPALTRLLGMQAVEQTYSAVCSRPGSFLDNLLGQLEITSTVSDLDRARIPKTGPAIVVGNHPTGMLDGIVLAQMLRTVRTDVKILANGLLSLVPELAELLITVDLSRAPKAANIGSLRACLEHLESGGLLVVFPAGQVSTFDVRFRGIRDIAWHPAIARLIRIAARRVGKVAVVPAYINARTSVAFQFAAAVHPALRLALLPRELLNARGSTVGLRFAHAVSGERLSERDDTELLDYLRWRSDLLGTRQDFKARTRRPMRMRGRRKQVEPIVDAVTPQLLREEVECLPSGRKLSTGDGLETYIALEHEAPHVVREIGRLREETFRAAGEGTGKSCDLDRFDGHYLHLFVWNPAKSEIAGAYRLAVTSRVREQHGMHGLYTATLFEYGDAFLDRMGPALELGRSFVRKEYQRSFAPLLLLWKSIGRFVADHPQCRVLFGPVSISSGYQPLSRDLMVAYLEKRATLSGWVDLVASKMPFRPSHNTPDFSRLNLQLDDLSDLVSDIEPDGRGVPVLLRHYLKLGGRLLGFNVDPDFANALDGLIVVDLLQTERRLLDRYLGKAEAAAFLAYQKGTYAA